MPLCTGKDVVQYLGSVMDKVVHVYHTAEVIHSTGVSNAVLVFIVCQLHVYKVGREPFT